MVHEHSSRSHLVVTLTVISQAPSFFSLPRAPSTEALNVDGELNRIFKCVYRTISEWTHTESEDWTKTDFDRH